MRDEAFFRGQVPMTKREVRAVALSYLEMRADSVLLDIGSGTGSVSVEAGLLYPEAKIFAFEKAPEAVQLTERNARDFGLRHFTLIPGDVSETLETISWGREGCPLPTHAFIGGSGGRMTDILNALLRINPACRIVITVVTMETMAEIVNFLQGSGAEAEICQLQASRGERMGRYHLMMGQNPVYIVALGGKKAVNRQEAAPCQ